jgi:hypothetical protein
MSKKTINKIADDIHQPFEFLAHKAEKVSLELSITLDDAKQRIADNFGIPTWYQLERQLEATISQRDGGRELFAGLKVIRQCIELSKFDYSKLTGPSKQLLAMTEDECMNLPEYLQEHLSKISFANEFNEYLEGADVDLHYAIGSWAEYSNIRARQTLVEQLCEFVRFKINTQSICSSGDLLDRHSGMHMYARCQPDGSGLTLSEFCHSQSPRSSQADHDNFVRQCFHVIEGAVLNIPVNLGIIEVSLQFRSVDGERFYQDVFLKSRLKNLLHKKALYSLKLRRLTVEELTINISLSCLCDKNIQSHAHHSYG